MNAGKVLVAGGTGFVGSQAVKLFERLGYDVVVVSRTAAVNTAKTPSLLLDQETERKTRTWTDIEVDGLLPLKEKCNTLSTCLRLTGCHQELWL